MSFSFNKGMQILKFSALLLLAQSLSATEIEYSPDKTYKTQILAAQKMAKPSALQPGELSHVAFDPKGYYYWQSPTYIDMHKEDPVTKYLGRRNNPKAEVRHITRTVDKIIYDVIYRFDENGHRRTTGSKKKNQSKFIGLFGCSFMLGIGVNDEDTISSIIQNSNSEFTAYNFGITGAGPNSMLAQTEIFDFKQLIKESDGVFFSIYLSSHVQRALGYWPIGNYGARLPFYIENESGKLEHHGSFSDGRPLITWTLLKLGDLFGRNILNQRIFPIASESDLKKVCKMYTQSRENLKSKFPASELFVFPHPYDPEMDPRLKNCLAESGVQVVEGKYPGVNLNSEKYYYPFEGHPTKELYALIAPQIIEFSKKHFAK